MKKTIILLLALLFANQIFAQVGIGTPSPNLNAILELSSTDKGFLPPRMNTAQRDAISAKPVSLVIYNTDANCLEYWNGKEWISTCSSTLSLGSVASLDCANKTTVGVLDAQKNAVGVVSAIPYTGGEGGSYASQTIPSQGVTGLTAILPAGNFNNGDGLLTFNIIGTPISAGEAIFSINIGGKTCLLTLNVREVDEVCTIPGTFRSANKFNQYYRCIEISGNLYKSVYTCPSGYMYSEQSQLCTQIHQ